MKKSDVKAIFLILIILLLISALVMFGIITYAEIMRNQSDENYALYDANETILPNENIDNTPVVAPQENTTISPDENTNNTPVVAPQENTIKPDNNINNINNTPSVAPQENTTTKPNNNINNTPLVVPQENTTSNQIASTGNNQNQTTTPSNVTTKGAYYYNQLNSYSKVIYNAFKNNKENLKTGTYKIKFGKDFDTLLSQENGSDLLQDYYQTAMETFLYDNPDVFYLAPTKMYINIQTTKKVFVTIYEVFIDSGENANYLADGYTSKQQIENYEKQINQEVQKILAVANQGKNEYQKIKKIHDYLVENISYDQSLSKDNIYNMYGALVNKECVCEGYAKAFKYLLDKIGVESIIVIGDATDSQGKNQSHAWNYVKYDGTWYAIDVTWDDPIIIGDFGLLEKKYRYKYFLKGSETMNKDHFISNTFIDGGATYKHPVLSVKDFE